MGAGKVKKKGGVMNSLVTKVLASLTVALSVFAFTAAAKTYMDVQKLKPAANISLENQRLLCRLSTRMLKEKGDEKLIDEICARKRKLFR